MNVIRIQLYKEDTYMLRTDLPEIKTETLPGPKAKEQGVYRRWQMSCSVIEILLTTVCVL